MRYTRDHARIERNARVRARHAARREEIARAEREQRDGLKRRMIEYLGGACVRCGITLTELPFVAAWDFHHRDPSTKCFAFAGNYSRSWDVLRAELDKCDAACAICHRIIEATLEEPGRRRGRPPIDLEPAQGPSRSLATAQVAARAYADALRTETEREDCQRNQLRLFENGDAA